MKYLQRLTKEHKAIITQLVTDAVGVKCLVKINPTSGAAIYPRISKDYSANVFTEAQRSAIYSALNHAGYCNCTGSTFTVTGKGNTHGIEGIYIPA